ncbi:MAG: heavy-metal-associated domain-containing protein [Bacteroidales bacterium]
MKTILFLTVLSLWVIQGTPQSAKQETSETAEFKVYGLCGMCKTRIENAAKVEGVHSATWSQSDQMLSVEYSPSKVSVETLHKNVAEVGHDTKKVKASDDVYNNLPACCKYERMKHDSKKENCH